MKKLISVPYPSSLHRYTKAQQFAVVAVGNTLFVLRVYEQDILIVDLGNQESRVFARYGSGPLKLTGLAADSRILQTHCIAYANETLFTYCPSENLIRSFAKDGAAISEIPCDFQVLGFAPARDSLYVVGLHDQHLLHDLNPNGSIKRSFIRVTDSFATRNLVALAYSHDKRIVSSESGTIFVLSEPSAGIIDALDGKSGDLKRRFALIAEEQPPIGQICLGGGNISEPSLMLIWPPNQPGVKGISRYGHDSLLVLSGSGRHVMVLSEKFEPNEYFSLPTWGPSRTKSAVFVQEVTGGRWIVGLMDGEIWLAESEELTKVSREEYLSDILAAPWWERELDRARLPHLGADEIKRQTALWQSIDDCSLSCVASLDADGSVLEVACAEQGPPDAELREKIRKAIHGMKFSPRIVDDKPVPTKLRILLDVNGWAKQLLSSLAPKGPLLP